MNKALLIIDVQNDYFRNGAMPLAGSGKACKNARLVLDDFRRKGLPVIHIQHLADRPGSTFFLPGTKGADIHRLVRPLKGEKVFVKHSPNSFQNTGLSDYLKTCGITDLTVCGMMTHMCVDATVRAAKDLEFNVTLIGDACATKDLEINGEKVKAKFVHVSFLAALGYYYSKVIRVEEFLK